MSILGNPITLGGGGADLNIDFGSTPPADTSKLWVPLANKPDNIDVDIVVPFGDEVITLDANYTQTLSGASGGVINGKLYITAGFSDKSSGGSSTGNIYVYNPETKVLSDTGDALPSRFMNSFSAVANGSLYVFGGQGYNETGLSAQGLNTIYKYTPSTHEVKQVALMGNVSSYFLKGLRGCVHDNKIYYFGGYNSSGSVNNHVAYLDLDTETVVSVGNNNDLQKNTSAAASWGQYIYTFGGNYGSTYYTYIFRYDPSTNKAARINEVNLSVGTSGLSVAQFGQYVYLFAGITSSGYSKYIYRFDCETETITKLNVEVPADMVWSYGAINGTDAYVFGGNQKAIYKFVIKSLLTQNSLLIQHDFYSAKKRWVAINEKNLKCKLYPINAYLGDSQNYAEVKTAYLYDTTDNKWKTLDGVSYTADMLSALNIMGVT